MRQFYRITHSSKSANRAGHADVSDLAGPIGCRAALSVACRTATDSSSLPGCKRLMYPAEARFVDSLCHPIRPNRTRESSMGLQSSKGRAVAEWTPNTNLDFQQGNRGPRRSASVDRRSNRRIGFAEFVYITAAMVDTSSSITIILGGDRAARIHRVHIGYRLNVCRSAHSLNDL